MKSIDYGILITFILYLLLMLGIGWYFFRRTRNLSDYILGGRGLNKWVTSISAQASDMSGWLLMGLPGLAYVSGLGALWMVIGLAIGTYINWRFIAKRLRVYTEVAGNSITLPDFFENRFYDKTHILRIISAFFILIFFTIYTSSGFVAGAKLFQEVFHFNYDISLLIGVFIIIAYTFLGGFSAVCWTDLIQGMLMFFAVVFIPVIVVFSSGGLSKNYHEIEHLNSNLLNIFTDGSGNPISIIVVVSMLGWGLGYMGQPHILSRFMAIKSADKIKDSRRIAMIWVIISLLFAVFIGLLGNSVIHDTLPDKEKIFMVLANLYLPSAIAGIFLSAILAAIMSTADSQLLVASSSITKDFYALLKKRVGDKELVWISRFAVILVAIVAFIIALNPENTVLELVEFAWAGFGSAFGPIVLFALFWNRMTKWGAFAGIISGGATVLVWNCFTGGVFEIYEMIPGVLISSVCVMVFSLLDKMPLNKVINEFEIYKKKIKQ